MSDVAMIKVDKLIATLRRILPKTLNEELGIGEKDSYEGNGYMEILRVILPQIEVVALSIEREASPAPSAERLTAQLLFDEWYDMHTIAGLDYLRIPPLQWFGEYAKRLNAALQSVPSEPSWGPRPEQAVLPDDLKTDILRFNPSEPRCTCLDECDGIGSLNGVHNSRCPQYSEPTPSPQSSLRERIEALPYRTSSNWGYFNGELVSRESVLAKLAKERE